jgi:hypothetical protein
MCCKSLNNDRLLIYSIEQRQRSIGLSVLWPESVNRTFPSPGHPDDVILSLRPGPAALFVERFVVGQYGWSAVGIKRHLAALTIIHPRGRI